ncbi:MAG TPA: hypothetical protein VGE07_26445 [Herpetosiphonaceae bacterium]
MRATFALMVCLLLAALAGPAAPAAAQLPPRWGAVTGVADVDFTNVFMYDATQAWAVGNWGEQGRLYRLKLINYGWQIELAATFDQPLADLSVVSPTDLWVTGRRGLLARWDGGGWNRFDVPPGMSVTTIQMLGDGRHGWAAGYAVTDEFDYGDAVVLRYQDGEWSRQELPEAENGRISDLHFSSQDSGWAVGSRLWRYRRGAWTVDAIPNPCENTICYSQMNAVRALGPDTALAVGTTAASCGICGPNNYALAFNGSSWQQTTPHAAGEPVDEVMLGLALDGAGNGFAVGSSSPAAGADHRPRPAIYRRSGSEWALEGLPVILGTLAAISIAPDGSQALAAGYDGLILSYNTTPRPQPTVPTGKPIDPDALYFEQVSHSLRGAFRRYWERNGGLPVFGFPLTEEFDEMSGAESLSHKVQYFERQRFELHPQNAGTPYEVQLGLLGKELLAAKRGTWESADKADPASPHYFPQTGQAIAPEFWEYWRGHGLEFGAQGVSEAEALALFGYPISPARVETNADGDQVLTQWFERARFEYHPANPPASRVLLGRLAAELLAERGW